MAKTIDQILTDLLNREGGYVNDPDDPGGPTKYGITIYSLKAYIGDGHDHTHADATDVRMLTAEWARKYYTDVYVKQFDWLPDMGLLEAVLDCAVNHGESRAKKWLQKTVNVVQDGMIGPRTKSAVNQAWLQKQPIQNQLGKLRIQEYARLISSSPSRFGKYASGWINRALEFMV